MSLVTRVRGTLAAKPDKMLKWIALIQMEAKAQKGRKKIIDEVS